MRLVAEVMLLTCAGGLALYSTWVAFKGSALARKGERDLKEAKLREDIARQYEEAAHKAWAEAYAMASEADRARAEAARLIAGPLGVRLRSKDAPS